MSQSSKTAKCNKTLQTPQDPIWSCYSKFLLFTEIYKIIILFLSNKGKLKEDTHPAKWKWTCVKQSGARPTIRSGLSLAVVPGNRALCFGGVFDEVSLISNPSSDFVLHWLLFTMKCCISIFFEVSRQAGRAQTCRS